jgi:hypothetical protein
VAAYGTPREAITCGTTFAGARSRPSCRLKAGIRMISFSSLVALVISRSSAATAWRFQGGSAGEPRRSSTLITYSSTSIVPKGPSASLRTRYAFWGVRVDCVVICTQTPLHRAARRHGAMPCFKISRIGYMSSVAGDGLLRRARPVYCPMKVLNVSPVSTRKGGSTSRASRRVVRRGFSGSGRTCEAAPNAVRVAAGRVRSWWCVGSLGRCWGFLVPGSASAVAGRGCATRVLRRGGRRVGVLRLPPPARAGWHRSPPG